MTHGWDGGVTSSSKLRCGNSASLLRRQLQAIPYGLAGGGNTHKSHNFNTTPLGCFLSLESRLPRVTCTVLYTMIGNLGFKGHKDKIKRNSTTNKRCSVKESCEKDVPVVSLLVPPPTTEPRRINPRNDSRCRKLARGSHVGARTSCSVDLAQGILLKYAYAYTVVVPI